MYDLTIEKAKEEDIPGAVMIERACFSDPWSEDSIRHEVNSPSAVFLVEVQRFALWS